MALIFALPPSSKPTATSQMANASKNFVAKIIVLLKSLYSPESCRAKRGDKQKCHDLREFLVFLYETRQLPRIMGIKVWLW